MKKLRPFLIIIVSFISCKGPSDGAPTESKEIQFLQISELPSKSSINPKASAIVGNWKEFNDFDAGLDALYSVTSREELAIVLDDLVERQKHLENEPYPESFDIPQVKSRQKILKTFILKTRAAVEYRTDATPAAVEMITAYNSLRNQFNVIVNNTLDTKLLTDE